MIRELHRARKDLERRRLDKARVTAEIESKYGASLESANALIADAQHLVDDLENECRKQALELFRQTGDKNISPGVKVQMRSGLAYDQGDAEEFCRAHYPQALIFNARVFEAAFRKIDLDFATPYQKPVVTISRDLSEFIE